MWLQRGRQLGLVLGERGSVKYLAELPGGRRSVAECGSYCVTVTFVAWVRLGTIGHYAALRLDATVGTDDVQMTVKNAHHLF